MLQSPTGLHFVGHSCIKRGNNKFRPSVGFLGINFRTLLPKAQIFKLTVFGNKGAIQFLQQIKPNSTGAQYQGF